MPTTTEPNEAHLTAAVQRCCQAYHRELAIPRPADGNGSSKCFAKEAYRQAMPYLTSPDNIDAFIACVAQGMLLGAINPDDATKLLYAAQVAIGSRRARLQTARFNSSSPRTQADTPHPLLPVSGEKAPPVQPEVKRDTPPPSPIAPPYPTAKPEHQPAPPPVKPASSPTNPGTPLPPVSVSVPPPNHIAANQRT